MDNRTNADVERRLAEIARELRFIRRLLVAVVVGIAILVGLWINTEITILAAMVGMGFFLLLLIAQAVLNWAVRRRREGERLRELSGR